MIIWLFIIVVILVNFYEMVKEIIEVIGLLIKNIVK
jgi:hypothetical protein